MNPSTLPNIPWEDRPAHSHEVVWRYSANPIIPRDLIPSSNSIFNSAVVPFEGAFAGVFRCDNKKREMNLHAGFSPDGIHWSLETTQSTGTARTLSWPILNTATTRAYSSLKTVIMSPGAMATTAPPSASVTPLISRNSSSSRMPCCPSTATACFSPAG